MPGPLTGIRVLDLTRVLAGPLCTMALGDLGADVIKVERPGTGDETRGWGPPFDAAGQSAYFLAVNRNKLSVALDLDLEADGGILLHLLAGADVVVENFLPGTLERRGLE
ncbi:MAG TPA: CoA transferase, partial [Gemmatimonadales bacterium]|nr:CoA transferase [Gemmatimonadales bacterium]